MPWYYDLSDPANVEIYDHTGANVLTVSNPEAPLIRRDAQGVPVVPDVRNAIIDALISRGQADMYALRAIAEALTGANFEEGLPPAV